MTLADEDTAAVPIVEPDKVRPPAKRRRLIDYPRRGRRGPRRWLPSFRLVLGSAVLFVGLLVGAFFVALAVVRIPQPNDFATRQASIFEYADGSTQIAHLGVNRVSVPLRDIPPVMRHAALAAEDRSFYSEPGVSPTGILRALRNDVTGSGDLQGGSTITQQYVKNYYLSEQQTLGRKLQEILVSIKVDDNVSKDEVLRNYLNTIYFARGAYGVETAARAYFGVPVSALADDPAEAAYLAALVQSPYYYATADSDPAAATALRNRWNYVLDGMVQEHWLSAAQRATLVFPTPIAAQANGLGGTTGYLVNAAMQSLDKLHAQNPAVPDSTMIAQGGYTVVTTFDAKVMHAAAQAAAATMATLDPAHNPADRDIHLGLAAVDRSTGAVLGFYGGPDYVKQGFDDALQAAGPMGSAVSTPLVKAVTDVNRRQQWSDVVAELDKLGIHDANPADDPPSDDDLTATPVRAAAAYQLRMPGAGYHEPYEVAKVLLNGQLVWQAAPTSVNLGIVTDYRPLHLRFTGIDGSNQWAWTVGGADNVAIAVDMYATNPNGKGNRALTGISPPGEMGMKVSNTPGGATGRTVEAFYQLLSGSFRARPPIPPTVLPPTPVG